MKNFRIGTILGVPIKLNVTLVLFLPVLGWLISRPEQIAVYSDLIGSVSPHDLEPAALRRGAGPVVIGVLGAVGLFAGVLLHELGHAWAARRFDVVTTSITLWIFGGMAHIQDLPEHWEAEFWIAAAGPVTSLLLAGAFYLLLVAIPSVSPVIVFVVGWLAVVNLSLVAFNLLPAFPMDGGRILRAFLARSRPYAAATQTAASVGKFMAVLLGIAGVFGFSPILILVALFVYIAATSESRLTVIRELLRGVSVADIMTRDVRTVSTETTVRDLIERMIRERHPGYPVVDGDGTLAGLVTMDDVREVPESGRDAMTVGEIMRTDPSTVLPEDDAFDVLTSFSTNRSGRVLVASEGRLVGIVSQTDLVRTLEIMEGIRARDGRPLPPEGYA